VSGGAAGLLRVQVLGPVWAWRGEQELELGAPRQRAVLAVLAMRANQQVSRDELVDAVWENPPKNAVNSIHIYVAGLRQALEPGRGQRAAGRVLVTNGPGYQLRLQPGQVDAAVFDTHLVSARRSRAGGDPAAAARSLEAALGLWLGSPLAGIGGPWAAIERTRLGEAHLSAVEDWAEVMLALARHGELVGKLAGLAGEHPLRERFRCLLMLALYRCGRQAEALEVFHDARRVLSEDLGIDPGPGLRRVHEQILSADPALDLGAPVSITQPEHDRSGSPLVPAQLPHDVAGFAGRGEELSRLTSLLEPGGDERPSQAMVILVIDGAAGVGKTALAVHFGHRVADRFPAGQLYIDLRGFDPRQPPVSPAEALGQLLRDLGADPRLVPADPNGQAGTYRSILSGQRMLIILDNAATADQVRPLLPGSGSCAVVITSRNRLGSLIARDGARRVHLDILLPAQAIFLLAAITGTDRVAAEPRAAREIARLCGHLPLALRIAAERLNTRPYLELADLAGQLAIEQQRLDLLACEDEATAVRAALATSYHALTPRDAGMFRLLSLNPSAGISTAAAAALGGIGTTDAQRMLQALAAAHLLEETGSDRYRSHDLVRVYAAECASSDEPDQEAADAVARVLAWYLHTADRASRVLAQRQPLRLDPLPPGVRPRTFEDQDQALAWFEAERANIVAATRQAAHLGHHALAWQLPVTCWDFFYRRKHPADWVTTSQIGLASARRIGDQYGQGWSLHSLGDAYGYLRRYSEAVSYFREALAIRRSIGDREGEAWTRNNLGGLHQDQGLLTEAIDYFQQALRIERDLGDKWGEGITLTNIGETCQKLGQFEKALDRCRQARIIHREIGDRHSEAWTLNNLACTYKHLQRWEDAITHCQQALVIQREIGDCWGQGITLNTLGEIHQGTRQFAEALDCYQHALAIQRNLGDLPGQADTLHNLGNVLHRTHHTNAARECWDEAQTIQADLSSM
jgi:DNA-binding SARP family transcriptional activator/tetratricopeptide (TPR) repeat protein